MKNINQNITNYLLKDSDYAIQLIGNWGIGKTFFYRKNLEKLIANTQVYNNAQKKYKPIYLSLFGLKSTEDIATKVVFELFQSKLFKKYFTGTLKKKLKITDSILKIGLRGFLNFYRLGNVNDYLTDIKDIGENVLDTSELLICFDDLERKDTALNIEDLIGYINSLVDNGVKVLIIANEDLLIKDVAYKNLKEKIIGVTLEYIPDVEDVLKSIIQSRYSNFSIYKSFLLDNIELVVRFSEAINKNFRNVIYSLDGLQNCYSLFRKEIFDVKHEISDKLNQEIACISLLVLAFHAEYKSSNLKHSDIEDYKYDNMTKYFLETLNVDADEKEVPDTPLEKFITKYSISNENYHFFESIYNYATGYEEFQMTTFIEEFITTYKLDNGKVLPQYELLNSLGYVGCFYLSEIEYRNKTLQLINYAKEGLYSAPDYLTVMHFIERFDNVLELPLDSIWPDISEGLKKSVINKAINNEFSFSQFEMTLKMNNHGVTKNVSALYRVGMEAIKKFREQEDENKIKSYGELLLNNTNEFESKLREDASFRRDVKYYRWLMYINTDKLYAFIINGDNGVLNFMKQLFDLRYEDKSLLKDEIEYLEKLLTLLNAYRESTLKIARKSITKYLLNALIESLQTYVGKIPKTE